MTVPQHLECKQGQSLPCCSCSLAALAGIAFAVVLAQLAQLGTILSSITEAPQVTLLL
jgi:hypothetical protein